MLEIVKPFNIILWADTYKFSHWMQIPKGTKRLLAAVVARKALTFTDEIVAAGQTFISHVFANARLEQWMIDEAEVEVTEQGYEFNRAGWEYILRTYGGRIPLSIFGVEEGRVIKAQQPQLLITVEDDDNLAWLVPYFEPVIQSTSWSMTYTATICRYMYKTVGRYMQLTGSNLAMLEWFIHNFGDRGADGPDETVVIKAIAHAMLFSGSDCGRVNRYIKTLYNTSKAYTSSIVAAEHTTMCLNSDSETMDDSGAMAMVMEQLHRAVARSKRGIGIPLASAPIDTYDDERFVTQYVRQYKDEIIASGGRFVSRPDSGVPEKKLPQVLGWLEDIFGATPNDQGFRTMPWCAGAIYGDGMNVHTFEAPIKACVDKGYTLDNFVLGMGAGITNDGARDDMSVAMKTIAEYRDDGRWHGVLKSPKSDPKKKSLCGLVRNRERADGTLETYNALDENGLYDMFTPAPGHRRWLDKGYRDWRQNFDETRAWARKDAIVETPVVEQAVA